MRARGIWVLAIVLLAGLAPAAWAESHEGSEAAEAAPALSFVWTDHVPAAHAAEYEAEIKKVLAKMKETEEGKKVRFGALSGPEVGYVYVSPLEDLADLERANQEFMAATNAAGGMEVWGAASRLVDHGSGQLMVLRPDLSYTPANPREAEGSGQFRWMAWWYARVGHEAAIEGVAKKFAALYSDKKIDSGWRVYQAVTGDDLPLYLVVSTGSDAADYHANDARISGLLGDADEKLLQEASSHARRVEFTSATLRPDLSMGM